ncbi:MAG TPA: HNH endonuclease [Clostridiales bacterium]|nr:HNH endonuclease [Clostridiales bacterium]
MEQEIRAAAFEWLRRQKELHGDVFSRELLAKGFDFRGQRITLIGPQGIWKPKQFAQIPISITTVPDCPYQDTFPNKGHISYSYRGVNPLHPDNLGLRIAMKYQIPLIYFFGIQKGKYVPVWPVYVVRDEPQRLTFTISVDEFRQHEGVQYPHSNQIAEIIIREEAPKREYITTEVRQRLFQQAFREIVLSAYDEQCAFCRLRHVELLDAAHIIPDNDEQGKPVVNNGLSLCKIHHAAFDNHIVGVRPDYKIEVRSSILTESDGMMLKYGIQELHGKAIILPRRLQDYPGTTQLEWKYKQFKSAV